MRHHRPRTVSLIAIGAASTALLAATVVGTASPALSASRVRTAIAVKPVTPGSSYLALGDSVTFGYREATNQPPPAYSNAASFVAYPQDVGTALDLKVANASCPGETSLSLIQSAVQSNGCENIPGGGPGYRSAFPLHVSYTGTQLKYALQYLHAHSTTRLVTLMIGANDAFLCQETTADKCSSELTGVLKQLATDVADILKSIRTTSRYRGQIVIVNYYSLDYSNPASVAGSQALNATVDNAAKPFSVRIADGFGAFQAAAAQSGGNSCTAGLITALKGGGCGVHPSLAGQALLALAVEEAIAH